MGYYSCKIEQFKDKTRPNISRESRLDIIKANIQHKYEEKIDANLTFAQNLQMIRPFTNPVNASTAIQVEAQSIYDAVNKDSQALKYISSLSTQEYFDVMAKKEEVELKEYIDTRQEMLNKNVSGLLNIESNSGLRAKFYNLTGRAEEKVDEAKFFIHHATIQYSAAQEALTEWTGLTQEEKTDYIADRFDFEGSLSLDDKQLSDFAMDKEVKIQPVAEETNVQ